MSQTPKKSRAHAADYQHVVGYNEEEWEHFKVCQAHFRWDYER